MFEFIVCVGRCKLSQQFRAFNQNCLVPSFNNSARREVQCNHAPYKQTNKQTNYNLKRQKLLFKFGQIGTKQNKKYFSSQFAAKWMKIKYFSNLCGNFWSKIWPKLFRVRVVMPLWNLFLHQLEQIKKLDCVGGFCYLFTVTTSVTRC